MNHQSKFIKARKKIKLDLDIIMPQRKRELKQLLVGLRLSRKDGKILRLTLILVLGLMISRQFNLFITINQLLVLLVKL